jgi:hypothetical protein
MAGRPATAGWLAKACTLRRSARSSCATVMRPGLPMAWAFRPAAMPSATACPAATLREQRITSAPAPVSTRTVSAPRPELPPAAVAGAAAAAAWAAAGGRQLLGTAAAAAPCPPPPLPPACL